MLSIEDIYREMGKNIFICPLNTDNFRDNSIDLTASEFAWTLDGEDLYDQSNNQIKIPGHATACIYTKEAIYVSKKIGGTYHTRVSLAMEGFSHISTTLDAQYCGQSLIMMQNTTDGELCIPVGERLVTIIFSYLETPICESVLPTPANHANKIAKIDKTGKYKRWCDENPWVSSGILLRKHFDEYYLEDFRRKRKIYAQRKNFLEQLWSSEVARCIIKYFFVVVLFVSVILFINKQFSPIDTDIWVQLIGVMVACFVPIVVADISNRR